MCMLIQPPWPPASATVSCLVAWSASCGRPSKTSVCVAHLNLAPCSAQHLAHSHGTPATLDGPGLPSAHTRMTHRCRSHSSSGGACPPIPAGFRRCALNTTPPHRLTETTDCCSREIAGRVCVAALHAAWHGRIAAVPGAGQQSARPGGHRTAPQPRPPGQSSKHRHQRM